MINYGTNLQVGATSRDGLFQIVDTARASTGCLRVTVRDTIGGGALDMTRDKRVRRMRDLARRTMIDGRRTELVSEGLDFYGHQIATFHVFATEDPTGEQVTVWADGFGRWFARVDFPEPGYGPQYLDGAIDRIRAKARRAIKRAVLARGEADTGWTCRVVVAANNLDHMNRMRSITYGEV
ncbi:hypothetical protein SEA_MACGULLY_102 [Rhodococcus phage MacGully]|nr:hypothetical protein SEA_MACGULLY_102 [Rhodococcus phage MacGully]